MERKLQNVIESLDWGIYEDENTIELSKCSPLCDEDFSFCVSKETPARDIVEYAADFDADEHAEMWVDKRGQNGVPNSIRALIEDADAIQVMLDELAEAVSEFME